MTVNVDVIGQKIKLASNQRRFVSNTKGFIKLAFNFSDDWSNLVKIAQFSQNGICYEACLDANNSVSLPPELSEGDFCLSLYAEGEGLLARTLPISLKMERCIVSDNNKIVATYRILSNKISSTVSNPIVNYSVSYQSEKTQNDGVTVKVRFTGWLDTGTILGQGIRLTALARINDGNWKSVSIKDNTEVWNNTSLHTSEITLSSPVYSTVLNLDFYITRNGSTMSGLAGVIRDSYNPVKYFITI